MGPIRLLAAPIRSIVRFSQLQLAVVVTIILFLQAANDNSTFGQVFHALDELVDATVKFFSELPGEVLHQIRPHSRSDDCICLSRWFGAPVSYARRNPSHCRSCWVEGSGVGVANLEPHRVFHPADLRHDADKGLISAEL